MHWPSTNRNSKCEHSYIRLWTYLHTFCEAFILFSIIPASTIRLSQVMKRHVLPFAAALFTVKYFGVSSFSMCAPELVSIYKSSAQACVVSVASVDDTVGWPTSLDVVFVKFVFFFIYYLIKIICTLLGCHQQCLFLWSSFFPT